MVSPIHCLWTYGKPVSRLLVSYTPLARAAFEPLAPAVCVLSRRRVAVPSVSTAAINISAGTRQRGLHALIKVFGRKALARGTRKTYGGAVRVL